MNHSHQIPAFLMFPGRHSLIEPLPPSRLEVQYAEVDVPHWGDIAAELPRPASIGDTSTSGRRNYVVVLTSGTEDEGKRATLAFSAACTALSLDLDTQVFLVGDGSHWAYEGAADGVLQRGFPPLAELIDTFIDLGGAVHVCATCDGVCSVQGADGPRRRRREVEPRGLASVLSHMIGGGSVTF